LLQAIHAGAPIAQGEGSLDCRPTSAFAQMPHPTVETVTVPSGDQSNTTILVDNHYVLKILRKISVGVHPEIEIGRFLVEHTDYKNAPDLLGSIELVEGDQRSALLVAH